MGFGADYVDGYFHQSRHAVFLHIYREKIAIPPNPDAQAEGPEKKITRLAIGVEGGFEPDANKPKFEYKDYYNIVVFPDKLKIPYPNVDLPLQVNVHLSL